MFFVHKWVDALIIFISDAIIIMKIIGESLHTFKLVTSCFELSGTQSQQTSIAHFTIAPNNGQI